MFASSGMKRRNRHAVFEPWLAPAAGILIFLAVPCTGFAEAAQASPDAETLLTRMSRAVNERNYDGVFIYQRGQHNDSMRIIHRFKDGVPQERLVSLSGSAREVIRNGETVTCIFPDNRAVIVEKSRPKELFPSSFQVPLENTAKHYRFGVLGRDRVAGRPTWVVGIYPKNAYRYGYRLWIDDETDLLLKSNIVDGRGRLLEQMMFTQIALPAEISDDSLKAGISGEDFTWYTHEDDSTESPRTKPARWRVKWLPSGFAMRDYARQPISTSRMPVDHMVYSDGLAMVSVFVERLEDVPAPLEGFSSMGAVNAYSMVSDSYQVTVVGEVPPITVRQIAASVVQLKE